VIGILKSQKGSASVILIMVLLALAALSVLAILAARSDLGLAEKNLRWTKEYYAVDSLAEEALAQADKALRALDADTESVYYALAVEALLGQGFTVTQENGMYCAQKDVAAEGLTQHIEIGLMLTAPTGEDCRLRITRWRLWQQEFTYRETDPVWTGGEEESHAIGEGAVEAGGR